LADPMIKLKKKTAGVNTRTFAAILKSLFLKSATCVSREVFL
jgi:hypothetical protein